MSDFTPTYVEHESFVETYHDDEDVLVQLQLTVNKDDGMPIVWLHCDVHQWNKRVFKKIKSGFRKMKREAKDILKLHNIDCLYTCTPNPKWCKMLGPYEKIGELESEDGQKLEVIEWELA